MRWRRPIAVVVVAIVALGQPTASAHVALRDGDMARGRSFTIAATGDIIAHTAVNDQALEYGHESKYDYAPMFSEIQPLIAGADLAICHLEGPIAPQGVEFTGQPVFGSPAAIAASIVAVGYDRCSTASNHSMDKGVAGIDATLDAFEAAGLGHSGTARTPAEAAAPILSVNGVKVAHLSYAYSFNGARLPTDEPWRANLIDPARILADAADARARGAEFVVVSLHWGAENQSPITGAQRSLANTLTAGGLVDLIIGHHVHLLQSIEQINGKWVVFGMGNILSNERSTTGCPVASQDGMVVRLSVSEIPGGGFRVARPVVTPTWVMWPGLSVLDVAQRLNDPALPPGLRRALTESWERTQKTVGAYVTP